MTLDEEAEGRLEDVRQIKDERPQTVVLTLISQENEDVLLRVRVNDRIQAAFKGAELDPLPDPEVTLRRTKT